MLKFKRNPFMDAEGASTGAATGTESAEMVSGVNPMDTQTAGQEGADEPKTGTDVKSEAQKIADAMLAKKMKNMPSKEELAAFRKWQDDQKTEAQRIAEAQKQAEAALTAAEKREARANAMIAAAAAGLKPEHIEDAVILAMARADGDTSMEDAIAKVVQSNPSWRTGTSLPESGSNPAGGADKETFQIKRHF